MTEVRQSISKDFFDSQIFSKENRRDSAFRKSDTSNRVRGSKMESRGEFMREWKSKNLTPIAEEEQTTMNRYTKAPNKEGVKRYFKGVHVNEEEDIVRKPNWGNSSSTVEAKKSKIELLSHHIDINDDGSAQSPLKSPYFKASKVEARAAVSPKNEESPFVKREILRVPSSEFDIYDEDSEIGTKKGPKSKSSFREKKTKKSKVSNTYDNASISEIHNIHDDIISNRKSEYFGDGRKPSIFNVNPMLFGQNKNIPEAPKSVHNPSDTRPSIFNVSPMIFGESKKKNKDDRISKTPRGEPTVRPSIFNVSAGLFTQNSNSKPKERSKTPKTESRAKPRGTIADRPSIFNVSEGLFAQNSEPKGKKEIKITTKTTTTKISKPRGTISTTRPSIFNVSAGIFGQGNSSSSSDHSNSSRGRRDNNKSSYSKNSSKRETNMRYTKEPSTRNPGLKDNLDMIIDEEEEEEDSAKDLKMGIYTPKTNKIQPKGGESTAAKTADRRFTTYHKKMSFGQQSSENKRFSVI